MVGGQLVLIYTNFPTLQVIHETSNVELPGFELEEGRKGQQVKETVLAVASSIRTNFGTQSTLILTTFR